MAVKYINRKGAELSRADWDKRQKDDTYRIVSRYDNGVVNVTLIWNGRVADAQNLLPTMYPVFVLLVKNYMSDGRMVNDPVENDKTFATEKDGVDAYSKFLEHWTACEIDESGKFKEADNKLAPVVPPPPPDPNLPTSVSSELDDLGAW
jgi:hypothetical protein